MMHGDGKSDTSKYPRSRRTTPGDRLRGVEGREVAKGTRLRVTHAGHRRMDARSSLERVRDAARRDKKMRFTALLHHVYAIGRLRQPTTR